MRGGFVLRSCHASSRRHRHRAPDPAGAGDGADLEAIKGLLRSYGLEPDGRENSMQARARNVFMNEMLTGDAESIARQIKHIMEMTGLDGMMLTFADYIGDLRYFGEKVLPLLRSAKEAG